MNDWFQIFKGAFREAMKGPMGIGLDVVRSYLLKALNVH